MSVDELLFRQTPHSIEAEQAVLGSILLDPACVPQVIELLVAEDFYIDTNRLIFETIQHMFTTGKKIDPVTVIDETKLSGHKDRINKDYIVQLFTITPTAANVLEYVEIVRGKSMLRELQGVSEDILELTRNEQEDPQNIAELAEQRVYAVRQGREVKGLSHIRSAIDEVYDKLDELAANPGKLPGLQTGFHDLDKKIGGLNKSDLILLASRPGMGKTSLILNMAVTAAKTSGKDVVIFQLEMSGEQLAERLLSSEAFVDSHKLRMGTLDDGDWQRIIGAAGRLAAMNLLIDDNPGISVAEMKAKCRRVSNLGLIVIDYLQLMQGNARVENRVQQVAEISRALKIMAKELNVPVLCCSQLSRGPEGRGDKRPMLSDLRESGSIEQDADIVMFIYREDYYKPDTPNRNKVELIVAKNRHGETGKIELQWAGQYTAFSSRDKVYYEGNA